jgi:release factor glutamine methyltransferase
MLRAAGSVFAEEEAALLLLDRPARHVLEERVRRRVDGEPLEYVLGWAEFCGQRVAVVPGVFVPRRRTVYLVELAAALLHSSAAPLIVDLCCGTGAIGLALGLRRPAAHIHGADVDPIAVACATTNLARVRGIAHRSDLFDGLPPELRGRTDLIVANAPYVPTEAIALMPAEARLYEHRVALDGGSDGLDLHRRIAAQAADWLRPGGHLLIETSEQQADRTAQAMRGGRLHATTQHDDRRDATVVIGTR